MTNLIITIGADLLVAILLIASIIYSLKLNKRIRILQDSKSELAVLIQKFDESTERATAGINEIHKASKKINDHINARVEKANFIADDLAFMIEKGNKVAEKIKENEPEKPREQQATATKRRRSGADAKSQPTNLTTTGDGVVTATTKSTRSEQLASMKAAAKAKRNLAISTKKSHNVAGAESLASNKNPKSKVRSKAEQELFEALNDKH